MSVGGWVHGVKFAQALGAHVVVFITSPTRRTMLSASGPRKSSYPAIPTEEMKKHTAASTSFLTVSAGTTQLLYQPARPWGNLTCRRSREAPGRLPLAYRGRRNFSGSNIGRYPEPGDADFWVP